MLFCHRSREIGASAALIVMAMMPSFGRSAVTTLVNDRWADADRTGPASPLYSEYGVDSDNDGDIESAWYNAGTGATAVATAGHLGLAPQPVSAGGAQSASWTTYFTPESTPVTLANNGDFIHVTWTFTPSNVNANNTSQNFRVALVDSPSASRLTADGAPGTAAYTGYGMFMNMGQTLGNSSPFRLMERTNPGPGGTGAMLGTSGDWTAIGTTGATNGAHGYDNATTYTYEMTITRTAAGVDILSTMTGGTLNGTGLASVLFSDATPNGGSYTYDTFSIRPSGSVSSADLFDTTLFKVETNVAPVLQPEPATLAALAGGAVVLRRRRR
jgi:hypothetical protein